MNPKDAKEVVWFIAVLAFFIELYIIYEQTVELVHNLGI